MINLDIYTNLLVQMLAIPSVSRNEETRADFLQTWMENRGLTVRRKHNNLIVFSGESPKHAKILLNSHIDTVKPVRNWDSDPFLPIVEDDKITALGSNDAGASVVALVATYEALAQKNAAQDVVLVLSAEEEISGAKGIESVLKDLPSLTFALVGEPTCMRAAVAERGLMVIDALSEGVAGHAAREEGENAIYNALGEIQKIRSYIFPEKSNWLKDPSLNVTMIESGSAHNVVPDACHYVIDVRSNDKYSNEQILGKLHELLDAELKPRSLRLKSSFLPENHPAFDMVHNLDLQPFGSPTLSDMALMAFPSLKMGPGDSARSHTANEFILKSEIREGIDIYMQFIDGLLNMKQ